MDIIFNHDFMQWIAIGVIAAVCIAYISSIKSCNCSGKCCGNCKCNEDENEDEDSNDGRY